MASTDQSAASGLACPVCADGQPEVLLIEDGLEPDDAADLEIALKQVPHEGRVFFDDLERSVLDSIAKRHNAAHPDALLLRSGDLVADPLAGNLALKLGEGQKHVEGQPSHAVRRIERLRD